ncbi:MAG: heavy-metal-associated domain-containing protein [bacterium]|jgi:copper chaperone CopZ
MITVTLTIPEISCDACANSIQRVLAKTGGVSEVDVNVNKKQVTLDYDESETNEQVIRDILTEAGFPPA